MSLDFVIAGDASEEERMGDALGTRAFALHSTADPGDDALVAEAAKEDPHAFAALYEKYYSGVYRFIYHRVGNPSDAEDITSAVFMKALEALPAYRTQRNSFAPWLFRIARNAVIDFYRRRKPHQSVDGIEPEADHGDPVEHTLGNEKRVELRTLVEDLSPDQRDVVLMRYAADLSFSEIASALGKKEPAVRMLLHRGLRKLKTVIEHG